jgi:hypothetical protein
MWQTRSRRTSLACLRRRRGQADWVAPTTETLLLVVRERSVPLGRLAVVTERAADVARSWLEGLR